MVSMAFLSFTLLGDFSVQALNEAFVFSVLQYKG